jgi:hypothetical protein
MTIWKQWQIRSSNYLLNYIIFFLCFKYSIFQGKLQDLHYRKTRKPLPWRLRKMVRVWQLFLAKFWLQKEAMSKNTFLRNGVLLLSNVSFELVTNCFSNFPNHPQHWSLGSSVFKAAYQLQCLVLFNFIYIIKLCNLSINFKLFWFHSRIVLLSYSA